MPPGGPSTRTSVLAGCLLLAASGGARGEPPEPLPEPLTLEYALELAAGPHPMVEKARAGVAEADAGVDAADAAYGVQVEIEAALKARESALGEPRDASAGADRARVLYDAWRSAARSGAPSIPFDLVAPQAEAGPERTGFETNDSYARLSIRKRLYDFGRTRAAVAAARSVERATRLKLIEVIEQRRLRIMERFFDVLLADLTYTRDNEAMSIAYVRFDDARDRRELGRLSDIDVLERESRFQALRREVRRSQTRQRAARAALAVALNRPEDLPSELVYPELPDLSREREPVEALTARALDSNPRLKALRAEVEALAARVRAARRGAGPVLRGELEAGTYASPRSSDDELSAALVLEWPLVTGGRVEAEVARERASLRHKRAELAEAELEVRQAVLDLWLELDVLAAEREEVARLAEYRELYLDRSRALYALELTTDLGDAMTRISEVRLREARAELNTALAWARLDAVTGGAGPVQGVGPQPSAEASPAGTAE